MNSWETSLHLAARIYTYSLTGLRFWFRAWQRSCWLHVPSGVRAPELL